MTALVFGYAGKPYDPVTGLSDYGFRDYAPSLARFTTVDPIRDGSNWYAYCNSDPVNYVDMWGLKPVEGMSPQEKMCTVILYNTDPTPGSNEIVNSSSNVGHSWIGIEGLQHNTLSLGWGYSDGDPRLGSSVTGALLDTKELNESAGAPTSSYQIRMTTQQAQKIVNYYDNLESKKVKYNLGGASNDSVALATNCTESAVLSLITSGGLSSFEKEKLEQPFQRWEDTYPNPLPSDVKDIGAMAKDSVAPNPNGLEYRIEELNDAKKKCRNN